MSNFRQFTWKEFTRLDPPHGEMSATVNGDGPLVPEGTIWGLDNYSKASGGAACRRYADTGETPPDGETWTVELEYGDDTKAPRFADGTTSVARLYTDFGPPFDPADPAEDDQNRAEFHLSPTLREMGSQGGDSSTSFGSGMVEGDTVWLGWSERYASLDKSRGQTIVQFFTAPGLTPYLDYWSINKAPYNDADQIAGTGPCVALQLYPDGAGELILRTEVRNGPPGDWGVETNIDSPGAYEVDKWYDYVVEYVWSTGTTGGFRLWRYDAAVSDYKTYAAENTPLVEYTGHTDYAWEPVAEAQPASLSQLEIRIGVYRYNTALPPTLTSADYYMERHLGQLRTYYQPAAASSDEGYGIVSPKPNVSGGSNVVVAFGASASAGTSIISSVIGPVIRECISGCIGSSSAGGSVVIATIGAGYMFNLASNSQYLALI